MLQSRLSYSQIGTFSLAAYPYSLKLLWSPIVSASLNSSEVDMVKIQNIGITGCCTLDHVGAVVNHCTECTESWFNLFVIQTLMWALTT
jgi:hypothetical protein